MPLVKTIDAAMQQKADGSVGYGLDRMVNTNGTHIARKRLSHLERWFEAVGELLWPQPLAQLLGLGQRLTQLRDRRINFNP